MDNVLKQPGQISIIKTELEREHLSYWLQLEQDHTINNGGCNWYTNNTRQDTYKLLIVQA